MHSRLRAAMVIVLFAVSFPGSKAASGQEAVSTDADRLADLERQIRVLTDRVEAQRRDYEARLAGLEARLAGSSPIPSPVPDGGTPPPKSGRADLEAEFAKALAATAAPAAPVAPIVAAGPLKLLDISFDSLVAAGFSSATEDELSNLQAGGHDPQARGFSVQNLELTLGGVVDSYFRGDASIVSFIDREGETGYEVEEAYVTTRALPYGLQLKGGQYFTSFGRLNSRHPHAWSFVDQPLVNTRFLGGDGLRGAGAQLSWLSPLPFYAEALVSVQNARGETAASFLGVEGEELGGHPISARPVRAFHDLVTTPRVVTSYDLSDETTMVLGASGAFGPNGTGGRSATAIYGLDAYVKWKPLTNDHGWPFASLQTEWMWRNYEAGRFTTPDETAPGEDIPAFDSTGAPIVDAGGNRLTARGPDTVIPGIPVRSSTLRDWGAYAQIEWGFTRNWVAGFRCDFVDGGVGNAGDPFRERRIRYSPNLTWYPSEFSKVRLQVNVDDTERLIDSRAYGIFLQFEYLLGAHGAHKF
ncbi:MAG: hypothetical protein HYY93_14425 [Planctomycetes bacterium]|nr:hypothetical protein [Planctomycetota bacterium]